MSTWTPPEEDEVVQATWTPPQEDEIVMPEQAEPDIPTVTEEVQPTKKGIVPEKPESSGDKFVRETLQKSMPYIVKRIQDNPNDKEALYQLGRAQLLMKEYGPALSTFTGLAAKYPQQGEYKQGMANAEYFLGQSGQAQKTQAEGLSQIPVEQPPSIAEGQTIDSESGQPIGVETGQPIQTPESERMKNVVGAMELETMPFTAPVASFDAAIHSFKESGKAFEENKYVLGALKGAKGIAEGFIGGAMAAPSGLLFNMGAQALEQSGVNTEWVFAPVTKTFKEQGDYDGLNEEMKTVLSLADLAVVGKAMHKLGKPFSEIKDTKLTKNQIDQVKQEITPENLTATLENLDNPEGAKLQETLLTLGKEAENPNLPLEAKQIIDAKITETSDKLKEQHKNFTEETLAKAETEGKIKKLQDAVDAVESEEVKKILQAEIDKLTPKPKQDATKKEQIETGVQEQPEGRIKGGQTQGASISDSVQRATEGQKEVVPGHLTQLERQLQEMEQAETPPAEKVEQPKIKEDVKEKEKPSQAQKREDENERVLSPVPAEAVEKAAPPISEKTTNLAANEVGGQEKIDSQGSTKATGAKTKIRRRGVPKRQRKIRDERYKAALRIDHANNPYDAALQHFISGGEISPSSIEELFGAKGRKSTIGERRARFGIIGKNAPTIQELAHSIWENRPEGDDRFDTQDYRNAIEEVLLNHYGRKSMVDDILNRHNDKTKELEDRYVQEYGDLADEAQQAESLLDNLTEEELQKLYEEESAIDEFLAQEQRTAKDIVDDTTESVISFLKDNNIIANDPTIQKMGFVDLEKIVRAVGEAIKKGIEIHGDITRAINEAIDKLKASGIYQKLTPESQKEVEKTIREEHEPKEEVKPVTPEPVSEGEGKKALASRVVEGEAPKDVQDAIEKHGLNYSIESHPDAEAKAAAFIAEVGVEKALKAVRTGKVDGGAQTFVWVMAIDAVQKERMAETNPAKAEKLLEKETELINELDERVRSQGRGISALQAAYQVSDLGYRLGAILNRAKEAAGENGVSEILKNRLTELSKRFDEISQKYAEAEKKLKESPPEPIIREPKKAKTPRPSLSPEESTRKSELSKKYRGALNDVTRVLTLLAEKDFREYAALVFKEAAGDFKTFAREMINNVGKEIREYLPKLYKDLGGKENPEMQSIQSKLKREIDEYERRKREKDFTKKEPKEKPDLDEETFNLLVEKNRLKEEIDTEIEKERLKNRPMGKKIEEAFVDAVSLPKSLMASADMSAPLRQGAILSFRHPIMATRAMREMFRHAFSDNAHRDWLTRLKSTPEYYVIKKAELYLAEPTARLNAKEEQFISNIAEKIPIWGRVVKGSQRAYTGYLNKLRVDTFTAFHDALLREGVKGKELDAELKSYAEFINNASGRGTLGKFEESAPLLNAAFFSPRYVVSRFNLMNPVKYVKMTPKARMEALKTMGAYLGVGLMTMAIAQAAGADVEDDPRSADFGKIKVGNTRFDMWAGMSQMAVLISRMATGETKSISGEVKKLGEGYKPTTRGDVLLRFGRSKLSPSAGIATDFLVGKDFNGNEVTVKDEVLKSVLPLWASDIRKIYAEAGAGQAAAAGAASFFGVGVQNYKPNKSASTEKSQVIPTPIPK